MKKMVKIVLITILLALPALGTYVKTTLPKLGFATDLAMERKGERIESGKCQEGRMAVSIYCKNQGKWSEFANPIAGGEHDFNRDDFPVNFLMNAIPFAEKLSNQHNVVKMNARKYLTAPML